MTHQGRPWLTALTGFIALLMGFCEFYTYRIGWHPFSNPWNRARLLHVEDIPMVLAAGAATFIVLTLLLRLLEKIPPIPEKEGPGGSPLDAPFALIAAFLFLAWMPFFLVFYPGTGMNDTTDIMRAGIWAAGQHLFTAWPFTGRRSFPKN